MYSGVPTMTPACVAVAVAACSVQPVGLIGALRARRAMPKSSTFTAPSSRTITLSGFTSRCTSPARCAAPSALATSEEPANALAHRYAGVAHEGAKRAPA